VLRYTCRGQAATDREGSHYTGDFAHGQGSTMRIDPATGTLYFERVETRIVPALTRAAFLDSPLGAQARVWVRNEPHCSYRVEVQLGAEPFVVVLQFLGQTLRSVSLAMLRGRWGSSSWDDWSEESEREKQRAHDAWLSAQLGSPPYTYGWGEVESTYDPRSGSSSIVIQYAAPPRRRALWHALKRRLGR
jgi:hypothetical protein